MTGTGWDPYRNLDQLYQPRPAQQSRQFSSFDRTGGNNDGFEGTYSCLRTTEQGCVIAEHAGAGEITSIWFTREPWGDVTGTGNIIIDLDGREVLNAPLIDVVSGRLGAPYEWPLVGNAEDAAGGAVIKVPMPYRKSMRITVENNPYFYHVNYRTFADGQQVRSFNPEDRAEDVLARLRRFGVADPKPAAPRAETERRDFALPPGGSTTLAELSGPQQISQLRLRIPQVAPAPQVVDDGHAYGEGGGSRFFMRVHPDNEGIRLIRRYDAQIADQTADVFVDGQPVGQWRSGPARPGEWGVEVLEIPASITAGKSRVEISNRFVSSSLDVNEFRYDVHSKVGGDWVRTDVLDLGPSHPGEEMAHNYRIDNPVFHRTKLLGRYPSDPEEVAASEEVLEKVRLRITFDGKTTVDAPIGEFFGTGLGEHDVRTLMSSVDPGLDGWYTSWWPMPFRQNARVELVNTGDVPVTEGTAEVTSASADIPPGTAYFHATHRAAHTTEGPDWVFLDVEGSGTFYGVTHSMRGLIPPGQVKSDNQPHSVRSQQANQRNYLEGDERFYVDGSKSPAWHGTGSEDFYESGWYFRDGTTFSMPLAGNPSHELSVDGCQYDCTGAYRLLLNDAVPFSDGLLAGIEHGPNNDEPGLYSSTAYWYGGLPAELQLTDEIDLASEASRTQHGYLAEGESAEEVTSTFEGGRSPEPMTRTTTKATGPISFSASVDPENQGIRLVRVGDQAESYQAVDVRIDGRPAGRWLQPLGNPHHRWLEDSFDVPAELTAGKQSVRVELVPVAGAPAWNASSYRVLSR
ncbi:glycoside hydrolase family 172 protein [Saccharopolyspora rectivirgula]|uniref:glycoside hydrolase family 172 protein n=1 Tax=Saccharopolyspora rectivirgula TaxID=28042 RepID=UPI002409CA58|nr:glycoside hydrolase family 172 protein [Saccharopolyspora rectivirgula]